MATEVYTNHASSERDDQSSVASYPRKTAGGPFSALGNRLQRALSGERAVRGGELPVLLLPPPRCISHIHPLREG
jgi:hypothetical protein